MQCPNSLPTTKTVAGIEPALRQCKDPEAAEKARASIASIIIEHQTPKPNIATEERDGDLQTRRRNRYTPSRQRKRDSSSKLNRVHGKIQAVMSKPPFTHLKRNPTRSNEKPVNDVLKRLADISKERNASPRVPSNGTKALLFYGSVKVHNDSYPLRAIVSMIGSATYSMSKYVSHILTPYVRRTPSYIANFVRAPNTFERHTHIS